MDRNQLLIVFFLILIFVLYGLFSVLRNSINKLRHSRLMEDTPTARLRSAAKGYVEIRGKQQNFPDYQLPAPFTRTPCTWFEVKIQRYVRRSKNSGHWQTTLHRKSEHPLYITDGTGNAVVCPNGATIEGGSYRSWGGFSPKPSSPPRNIIWRAILLLGNYRYTERIMVPGDDIYVIGMLHTYSEENDLLLARYNLDPQQINALDSNRIHVLSNYECPHRRPFIISSEDQKKVILRYKLEAISYGALFVIFSGLTLWGFSAWFEKIGYFF